METQVNALIPSTISTVALGVPFCPTLAPILQEMLDGSGITAIEPPGISLAAQWWTSGGPLSSPEGTIASLALLFLCSFLFFTIEFSGGRAEDGGALGSARVKEGREVVKGSMTWDGRSEPKGRGYVYGFSRGLYLFEPDRHVICIGQTGSGKTRFQNIPSLDLLTFGESAENVVVSDVKSELIELCGDAIEARGYDVLLLDTQHPHRSSRFNPLKLVVELAGHGDSQAAEQAVEDLASAIVPTEREGQGSHWVNSARGLFSSVAYYVATSPDCPDCCRNMATVCRVINEGTEAEGADPAAPLKALLRSLPHDHPSRIFGSQFLSSGGNEMRSVLSTLKVNLRIYASGPIAWLTSGDDIDVRSVLTEKTALFLHVMDEGSPYNRLFEVLFDQLYKAVYSIADSNGGRVPRRLTILGDEWGNLGAVKCLPALLSLGRSYGLSWCGSVQNISQLNKYGERDGRRKILANCSVKVFLKLGEEEDRRYASELVGKTTRHTMGTSSSRGASSSSTTSYSEHADDVIRPHEWVEMAPDRDGAVVVKQAMNGLPASRAGAFRAPLADCTKTPTKAHFGLGTEEEDAAKRLAYQKKLDERDANRTMDVHTWCPDFPETDDGAAGEGMWGAL